MKKNIALIAGGYSGEFEVSLNSAQNIYNELDKNIYNIYKIIINDYKWYYLSDDLVEYLVDKNDFSLFIHSEKVTFDAAFITIHGTPGEDGKLQGYLDILNIPYNTCDATTSAITMNKGFTKLIISEVKNLDTAKSCTLFKKNFNHDLSFIGQLKFPLFIKPNNGGSSVGMSKVSNPDLLLSAIEKAFAEDNQILIEEFIKGREFSIGMANINNELLILPATEIITTKEFFDYEAKYTPGVTKEITPAELSEHQLNIVHQIVADCYQKLNCKGMVRIDFILEETTQNFYFIEVNTTPGQSANSLIPQQLRAASILVGDFYGDLIEECLRKN